MHLYKMDHTVCFVCNANKMHTLLLAQWKPSVFAALLVAGVHR